MGMNSRGENSEDGTARRRGAGRRIVLELAAQDFRMKYLGSQLGIVWAFIQPAVTLLLLWIVTRKALGFSPGEGVPYSLWLLAGAIPWFFLSDSVNHATQSILGYGQLVKKVVFPVGAIPLVKILSALAVHLIFLCILLVVAIVEGYPPGLHALQLPYYLAASLLLLQGICWITSSLIVFVRDIGYLTGIALQALFWLTPIFWSPDRLSPGLRSLLSLNPFHYIVEGYRDALIRKVWFWSQPAATLRFWAIAVILSLAGVFVFRRLRPHFADLL